MADAHPMATVEEHPAPARIMHFVHVVTMLFLIFTGIYINSPFFAGGMYLMRLLHFIFMWILFIVAVVRVWWAFFGAGSAPIGGRERQPDYRYFGPQKENRGTLLGTLKYYLFLQREAPPVSKYNGLQKGTYVFWLVLIVLQGITGLAIWPPTQAAFLPLSYALGGPIGMRTIHYLFMWLFILTVLIHMYLSALHFDELQVMFTGRERRAAS